MILTFRFATNTMKYFFEISEELPIGFLIILVIALLVFLIAMFALCRSYIPKMAIEVTHYKHIKTSIDNNVHESDPLFFSYKE
jgi:hypothetical protein